MIDSKIAGRIRTTTVSSRLGEASKDIACATSLANRATLVFMSVELMPPQLFVVRIVGLDGDGDGAVFPDVHVFLCSMGRWRSRGLKSR